MNQRYFTSILFLLSVACDDGSKVSELRSKTQAPEALDFGRVPIGLPVTKTFKVENRGSVLSRVTIEREGFDGEGYEFDIAEANLALAPGGSQEIAVTFQVFVVTAEPIQAAIDLVLESTDESAPSLRVVLTGQGVTPLTIEPNPLDFGLLLAGSSRELDVTITNQSDVAIAPSTKLSNTGVPLFEQTSGTGRFEIASTLGPNGALLDGMLEPGASAQVSLRYVADSNPSTDSARWSVLACGNPLCEHSIELKGESTLTALACEPPAIDFGTLNPGSSRTRIALCTNTANEAVELVSVELDAPPEISLLAPNEVIEVLDPGASFEVELLITVPEDAALGTSYDGSLAVRGWNPAVLEELPPITVPLTGAIGGADIAVVPSNLAFSATAIGTSDRKRIAVLNVGFEDLVITGVRAEGDDYSVGALDSPIAPGDSAFLEVTFSPSVAGLSSGSVFISSNDPDTPELEVPVIGEAVDLPPCDYEISPSSLNFGIVELNNVRTQRAVLRNVGSDVCLYRDLEVFGDSTAFSLTALTATAATIPAGGSVDIHVQFSPETSGSHTANLSMYISSPAAPNPELPLSGFGEQDPPLVVAPDVIDFGTLGIDCRSNQRTVTIYNTGSQPHTIDRIVLVGSSTSTFEVGALSNRTIGPGSNQSFTVRYHADDEGIDLATIEIYELGRNESYVVALEGEGAPDARTTDVFGQLPTAQVDVLFVIDHSGSMFEEQTNLAANFNAFIQTFQADGVDYQLGVTTTDVDDEGGRLVHSLGMNAFGAPFENRIVTPRTPNAQAVFAENVSARALSGGGAIDEAGFEAAYLALSANLLSGHNAGFLRPHASLAIVFVSDEEEQSSRPVDFYVNFFRSIKGFANTNLFSAAAIVGDSPGGCSGPGGSASAGARYIAAADMTGGVFGSICTSDWADVLSRLGRAIGRRASFILTNEPVPGTIEVEVDGVPRMEGVNWMYDAAGNRIVFFPLSVPESGQTVTVTYTVACL